MIMTTCGGLPGVAQARSEEQFVQCVNGRRGSGKDGGGGPVQHSQITLRAGREVMENDKQYCSNGKKIGVLQAGGRRDTSEKVGPQGNRESGDTCTAANNRKSVPAVGTEKGAG